MKHRILPITAVFTFFGFSQVALADMAISSSSFADGMSQVLLCQRFAAAAAAASSKLSVSPGPAF